MSLSPHFKYLIPGAILSAGGGGSLAFGLGLGFVNKMVTPDAAIIWKISTTLIVVGIVLLCIGLPLLIYAYRMRYKDDYGYRRKTNPGKTVDQLHTL
ncbi:MAG: hypothetical protein RBG13Loki_4303 [Promethearchaeota archaeon CR_4]|nr:MAG: hypothetical protein RBG13Loki_4303 [Candidatus Lokiarchaeota archaeon CR_4]